jgi:hypothetical protein
VSSYDPPPQQWRRRSRGDSKRSWRANRRRLPRRQQRKRPPQRQQIRRRQHPLRPRSRCLPKHRSLRHLPHQRNQRHRQVSLQRHRQVSLQRHQPVSPQLRRGRRLVRDQACHGTPAKSRPPLGLVRRRVPYRGHGLALLEDFLVHQLRGGLAHRGREIIRSPPRKEWVGPVRHVLLETADSLQDRVHPPAAASQAQEAGQELRECRGPTRQ